LKRLSQGVGQEMKMRQKCGRAISGMGVNNHIENDHICGILELVGYPPFFHNYLELFRNCLEKFTLKGVAILDIEENERMFDPLFTALSRLELTADERLGVIGNYMFIHQENEVFSYKHTWTRQYVYLGETGSLEGGILNTGTYTFPSVQDS
jgi:hypothetical protein